MSLTHQVASLRRQAYREMASENQESKRAIDEFKSVKSRLLILKQQSFHLL